MDQGTIKYLHKSDYLHVWVDEQLLLMYSEWLRPVTSEEYRAGCLLLASLLQENGVIYWIAEASLVSNIVEQDQEWASKTLVPLFMSSQVKKIARINASTLASYVQEETQAYNDSSLRQNSFEFRQFWSYQEAADWIAGLRI